MTEFLFSGWSARTIRKSRSSFEEGFLLLLHNKYSPEVVARLHGSSAVLADMYAFHDQPKAGPALVYRRFIEFDAETERFVAEYFADDGPEAASAEQDELVELDVRSSPGMPEEVFWSWIDVLGGQLSIASIGSLSRRLAGESEEMIAGFEQTLARLLHAIDHPANALDVDGLIAGRALGGDASLYWRCAVVAAGRQVYEQLLANPGTIVVERDAPEGEYLLSVASDAFTARTGQQPYFLTAEPYETASIFSLWDTTREQSRRPPLPMISRLEGQQRRLDSIARVEGLEVPTADPWYNVATAARLFAGRIATRVQGGYEENVIFLPLPPTGDPVSALNEAINKLLGADSVVVAVAAPQLVHHAALPMTGIMIAPIKRTLRMTMPDYLERYRHVPATIAANYVQS
ncbi:MAG: hypothetical protein JWO18_576 [Microbacteriaceae bacterium]|nr:hypothetical protein [Microbacteriaceae bacterium]